MFNILHILHTIDLDLQIMGSKCYSLYIDETLISMRFGLNDNAASFTLWT